MKDIIIKLVVVLSILLGIVFVIIQIDSSYNKRNHEDDVIMSEWISPDGVHYWYQRAGYHAMLAPRYDADGNLVIDKE